MYRPSIDLSIDSEALDKFCNQLIKRSRNKEKTLDCLVTLEAFISLFSRDSQGSDEFHSVITTIQQHSDKSRRQLLSEKAELLVAALRGLNIEAVTDIYLPLSRNGFYEILTTLVNQFSALEISILTEWAQQWLGYSKQRAAMASDFPDSTDFRKAGISIEQYQTMTDLERFLSNVNQQHIDPASIPDKNLTTQPATM